MTANDDDLEDIDTGPNSLQNYPVIRQAVAAKKSQIRGQLHSLANADFVIDFYAQTNADPSGHGEGHRWLGSLPASTREDGVAAIVFDIALDQAAVGEWITATATYTSTGDTSEFSEAVQVAERGKPGRPGGRPMMAVSYGPGSQGSDSIPLSAVQSLQSEAVERWQAGDASTGSLPYVNFQLVDFSGTTLGLASGSTIYLDINAAGWGWFIDSTPWEDSEFALVGNQGEQGRMDLLTVIMHEAGHVLGHDHEGDSVMQETLSPGTRYLPDQGPHGEDFSWSGSSTVSSLADSPSNQPVQDLDAFFSAVAIALESSKKKK